MRLQHPTRYTFCRSTGEKSGSMQYSLHFEGQDWYCCEWEIRTLENSVYHIVSTGVSKCFATPRTVARQTPLPMGFPRREHWSGLPFLTQGLNPRLLRLRIGRSILYYWAIRLHEFTNHCRTDMHGKGPVRMESRRRNNLPLPENDVLKCKKGNYKHKTCAPE